MSKWRFAAAAAVLSLLAACTDTQVAHKGDKLPLRTQMAEAGQPSPWMQVMRRFGALRGTSADPALSSLLRVARNSEPGGTSILAVTADDIASAGAFRSAESATPPASGKAGPSLNSLAARVAERLGSKLHTVFAGRASFYSLGQELASGGKFVPEGMTAAHRTLPFGTRLRVTDQKSGRSVVVVVNDRGPYVGGRVLDLSLGAARALGMTDRGVIEVRAEVI
jgi:rare lipoprotein A (peptidoglycan hydrolase)